MYSMLKGYPSIVTRKARIAREHYYERLLSMFKRPLVRPSDLIRERMEVDFLFRASLTSDRSAIRIFD